MTEQERQQLPASLEQGRTASLSQRKVWQYVYNKHMLLEGIFAAVPTPFYSDERVYFRKLEANIARYSRTLLSGILLLGSTGEAPELDDDETRDVLRVAADAASPEKVLIAGVGRESVKATVALAEAAAQFHYDVVLVRTPTYYASQMTPAAVLNYFRSVADHSPLPVLLYNIPRFVPYNIPIELVAELAQHPNILGIKDSTGSVERISSLVEQTKSAPRRTVTVTPVFEAVTGRMLAPKASSGDALISAGDLAVGAAKAATPPAAPIKTRTKEVGFQVLTGSAGTLLESLEAGASGAILGFAACAPQACQEVYFAWKDHDPQLAKEKQQRIAAPSQRIVGQLGIPGVKHACDFNGYYGGRARTPLLPVTGSEKQEIEKLLAGIRN
jgi:dihydrodipicolinate synthase/N-acetylneuraminate lyase